jgi:hypothetical protein
MVVVNSQNACCRILLDNLDIEDPLRLCLLSDYTLLTSQPLCFCNMGAVVIDYN